MGKRVTIENAELTITFDDLAYKFEWVNSVTINDARENTLVVSPQGTGNGIPYRNGVTTPVTADFVVREISTEMFGLLSKAFEDQERVDILLFDKLSGDQYTLDDAIIRSNPSNVDVAEGEDSMNVMVNTNCTPNQFKHKPPVEA